MMPAENVHIWWNTSGGRVTEVLVTTSWELQKGHQFNDGACWTGWMDSPGFGPEAVFGKLVMIGFLTPDHARNAIRQFAGIDRCPWARNMLGDTR